MTSSPQLDRRQLLAGAAAGSAAVMLAQNGASAQPGAKVTVFTHASVQVTPDKMVDDVALAIVGNKIAAMGPTDDILQKYPGADIYDGRGKALLPGLIDCHGHISMAQRGFNEDYGFPNESHLVLQPTSLLSADERTLMSSIGAVEAIKAGITSFVEVGGGISSYAGMLAGSGLRMTFAEGDGDGNSGGAMSPELLAKSVTPAFSAQKRDETMQRLHDLYSAWHGKFNDRIRVFGGPTLSENSSPELLAEVRAFCEKNDVGYTIHLSQSQAENDYMQRWYGMSPTAYLAKHDFLGPRLFAAHVRYMSDNDCDLLGKSRSMISHQAPMAGNRGVIPPIARMRRAGVTIANGTDNSNADVFETMRIAMVTERIDRANQKVDPEQPLPGMRPQPEDVFEDCTVGGAKATRREKELGSLEVGKTADIIVIDTMLPHLQPYGRFLSVWIHNGQPSDIEASMVDGAFVMRDRKVLTMDEAGITAESAKVGKRIWAAARAAGPVPVPGRPASTSGV